MTEVNATAAGSSSAADMGEAPPEAFGAALAGLPAMGPARLQALLQAWAPTEAWRRVVARQAVSHNDVAAACRPRPREVARAWHEAAVATDVPALWRRYRERGVQVSLLGAEGYPPVLAADHQAPAVLFHTGDLSALEGSRVAIIGTRRCTRYGRDVAVGLGRGLAAAGVRVVSGLALGIDGAAHEGALAARAAPPVGVVGSGLDVTYPRRHARLWRAVADAGALVGEAPLGAIPEPWRFPARNRIIAALAHVVVVVESHPWGGSRHTVDEAEARDVQVMAVPGPVLSPASAFTNQLLADSCHPARDVDDVIVALGLMHAAPAAQTPGISTPGAGAPGVGARPPPGPVEADVLDALGWQAASLDHLVATTARGPAEVSVALAHLEADGWVEARPGCWERVGEGRR